MTFRFLELIQDNQVATVIINRPEKLNAINKAIRLELTALLTELEADNSVKAVILTGAGDRAFSAGQDLIEASNFDGETAKKWMGETVDVFNAILNLTKPVIAALNGVAAGAGFQIALLCDVKVGHEGVRMGQPELNVGIPSILGSALMWDAIGYSRTVELTLTGRLLGGEECFRLGLINYLVPQDQVLPKALELGRQLAAKSEIAMQLTKRHLHKLQEETLQLLAERPGEIQQEAFRSGEPQKIIAEILERKKS